MVLRPQPAVGCDAPRLDRWASCRWRTGLHFCGNRRRIWPGLPRVWLVPRVRIKKKEQKEKERGKKKGDEKNSNTNFSFFIFFLIAAKETKNPLQHTVVIGFFMCFLLSCGTSGYGFKWLFLCVGVIELLSFPIIFFGGRFFLLELFLFWSKSVKTTKIFFCYHRDFLTVSINSCAFPVRFFFDLLISRRTTEKGKNLQYLVRQQ